MEPFLLEAVDSVLRQPEVDELVVATHLDDSPATRLITQHPDSRLRW